MEETDKLNAISTSVLAFTSVIGVGAALVYYVKSSPTPSVKSSHYVRELLISNDRWHARPSSSVGSLLSTFYSTRNHRAQIGGIKCFKELIKPAYLIALIAIYFLAVELFIYRIWSVIE